MAFLIAMMVLAIIVITKDLDKRRARPKSNKAADLAVRLVLLLVSISALIFVPRTVWWNISALYSNIGVAVFLVSLVVFCAGAVIYVLRADKSSDH